MDLLDVVILALRLGLVVVLYAFLVLVLRFAGRSLRSAARPAASRAPRGLDLRLVVVDPGHSNLTTGQVIDVSDGATLGRTAEADMVVDDPAVSANHAHISKAGRTWMISDLASTNGTLINEARIFERMPLRPGDVLGLGSVRLQVVAHEP